MKYKIQLSCLSRCLRDVAAFVALVSLSLLAYADADSSTGANIYLSACAGCHGAGGDAPQFAIAPNLRRFKGDDATFLSVVKNGRRETLMSPWQTVYSDAQILSILSYLKKPTDASNEVAVSRP